MSMKENHKIRGSPFYVKGLGGLGIKQSPAQKGADTATPRTQGRYRAPHRKNQKPKVLP